MKTWWQRRSLRFRLTSWYTVGGVLLLTAFSATIYFYVLARLAQPLDSQLRRDLADLEARLTVSGDGRVSWDGREVNAPQNWKAQDPWFELWDERGQLIRRLWPFSESRVSQLPVAPTRGRETISVFSVAEDLRLRVLSVPYRIPGHKDWMIRVMRLHEPVGDALQALLVILATSLPIVVAVLVIGGYGLTRQWLKPLDEMVAGANRITAEDLSRRLPVTNPYDELGRLAGVFNVTLDRLEDSFRTLDQFVTDASHELRTPLTTLRSVGEVGLRRSRTVEEYREIIASMLEEAQRMQLLVQRLLELASAESGAQPATRTRLRLDEWVAGCVSELGVLAEAKGQTLTFDLQPCEVLTDPIILRQALQNLVDNAIKYSPASGTIKVTAHESAEGCEVSVADEGPGISPEHRTRITERFFRTESARAEGVEGLGLGLSITKAYLKVLGGTLRYEPAQPHGSVFRITLPKI